MHTEPRHASRHDDYVEKKRMLISGPFTLSIPPSLQLYPSLSKLKLISVELVNYLLASNCIRI